MTKNRIVMTRAYFTKRSSNTNYFPEIISGSFFFKNPNFLNDKILGFVSLNIQSSTK